MNYTLITGASSGIGYELAMLAAQQKRNLLLVARDQKKLEILRESIYEIHSASKKESVQKNTLRPRVEILSCDLSTPAASKKIYEYCENKKIFIDELINNAGFGDYGEFSTSDLKRQLSMIDLNIRSLTELTHVFLPEMVRRKRGKIMNLGSVASFLPGPFMSVYFASKNYVLRFSEALAEELRGSGVSVTCLCPGPTKSAFGKNAKVSESHSTANPKTTALDVAQFGWYHMQAGTRVAIYGRSNRFMIQLTKFIPRTLLTLLVKKIQK